MIVSLFLYQLQYYYKKKVTEFLHESYRITFYIIHHIVTRNGTEKSITKHTGLVPHSVRQRYG